MNRRYKLLFGQEVFVSSAEIETINRLWILRHAVAHNAGFVTHHDSYRLRAPSLKERTIEITPEFLRHTRDSLAVTVRRQGDPIGQAVLSRWLKQRSSGDFAQDSEAYRRIKSIATVVKQRTRDLPLLAAADYLADRTSLGI